MFDTRLMNILGKAMDGSSLRQSVISNNIANVNTPGFKRSEVSFQEALKKTLGLKENIAVITRETGTSLRNDGNNVDIDMEMANLAENNLYYNGLAQLLSSQLSLLRTSITEGRR